MAHRVWRIRGMVLVGACLLLTPVGAWADRLDELERAFQTQQKAFEQQQQQMLQLQEEINRLRQERSAQQEEISKRVVETEKKAEEAKKSVANVGYDKGFFIRSQDNRNELVLRGYLQQWFIAEPGDRVQSNTFRTRRARLITSGYVLNDFGFYVEPDFTGNARLEEGWVSYKRFPEATLVLGQYKPRYSLDMITSSRDLDFAERAMIVRALAPDFQLGATLQGQLFTKLLPISYGVGVYNGCGRIDQCPGGIDNDNELEFTWRVAVTPLPQLTLGLNADFRRFRKGARGFATDANGVTVNNFFNPITATGFKLANFKGGPSGFKIDGERKTGGADLELNLYPLVLKGEYHFATQARNGMGPGGTDLPDLKVQGGYATLGYWIFGQKPQGLLANARYEFLQAEANQLLAGEAPLRVHAGTAGLTWYRSHNIRLRLNYIATSVEPKTNNNHKTPGEGGDVIHEGIAEVFVQF